VRDQQGLVRVLVNRCSHRGAQVCEEQTGNTKLFTCPYHHWSFNLEGCLVGVPFRRGVDGKGGMSAQFESRDHGLEQLKVAERHGVVFASYANDIESLDEYLGPTIVKYFDRVCDGRQLRILGRMQHRVHANWKLQVENLKDPFHAALLHSFFRTFGIWRSDQATEVLVDSSGKNSVLVSTATFKQATRAQDTEAPIRHGEFRLEDNRMLEYHHEFQHGTGAVMTIWPNLILLQQLNCLAMRHVRPDGPRTCVKTWTFLGYESDSPELLRKRLIQANLLGPSGLVTIDDNEALAITQAGMTGSPSARAVLEAGEGTGSTDYMMTEAAIRGFYEFYQTVMSGDDG
jgi:anthranilate 1,2-dioxygenase large subunit/salicylate 5-hydroxylase large subunit